MTSEADQRPAEKINEKEGKPLSFAHVKMGARSGYTHMQYNPMGRKWVAPAFQERPHPRENRRRRRIHLIFPYSAGAARREQGDAAVFVLLAP